MIKATMEGRRGRVLLLGITPENMTRLLADEPILIERGELVEMGLADGPFEVILMAGRTESEIAAKLGQHIPNPAPGERVVRRG